MKPYHTFTYDESKILHEYDPQLNRIVVKKLRISINTRDLDSKDPWDQVSTTIDVELGPANLDNFVPYDKVYDIKPFHKWFIFNKWVESVVDVVAIQKENVRKIMERPR